MKPPKRGRTHAEYTILLRLMIICGSTADLALKGILHCFLEPSKEYVRPTSIISSDSDGRNSSGKSQSATLHASLFLSCNIINVQAQNYWPIKGWSAPLSGTPHFACHLLPSNGCDIFPEDLPPLQGYLVFNIN